MTMARFLRDISRKRPLDTVLSQNANHDEEGGNEMQKCLTTLDLVSLGVGSCCGTGMYLSAGIIAAEKAGPGGVFSIFVAGLSSVLTGLHYAELAGICPHTSGSAYMYTYVTAGELSAFVIGWGLIIEYVIGTAAASVALSQTIHSVTENKMAEYIDDSLDGVGLPHVDFIAAIVCLLLTWLLASGAEMSTKVNNVLNGVNFAVWTVFVVASMCVGSTSNWTSSGGFFPFGYKGVLSAIPTAYFAFVGFDGLSTTGAECKNPVKSIPISIVLSIFINIIVFMNVVAGLTFDLPYSLLPATTAMLDVFPLTGYPLLKYVVSMGAVAGLFTSTFGSLFPLPRVLQAMAQDGLIFRYFSHVCPKRHTALRATVISGVVAACLAAFVELTLLIELVLIGTLLAYVIVTYATLIIRFVDEGHMNKSTNRNLIRHDLLDPINHYGTTTSIKRKASDNDFQEIQKENTEHIAMSTRRSRKLSRTDSGSSEKTGIVNNSFHDEVNHTSVHSHSSNSSVYNDDYTNSELPSRRGSLLNSGKLKNSNSNILFHLVSPPSTNDSEVCRKGFLCVSFKNFFLSLKNNVSLFLLYFYGSLFVACAILSRLMDYLLQMNVFVFATLAVVIVSSTCMAVVLMFIPQVKRATEGFRAPFVPLITVLTASINIYLMTSLRLVTWLLFLVWMCFGLSIYLIYGTKHSSLSKRDIDCNDSTSFNKPDTDVHESPTPSQQEETDPLLH